MHHLALLLTMLVALPSFAQTTGEIPRFDIGIILPLSGEQAAFGKEAQRGSDLALELFRQHAPQLGNRVNLIWADNKSHLSEIDGIVSDLISKQRCQTLIGGITSPEAARLVDAASKAHVSIIVPIASEVRSSADTVITPLALDDAAQGKLIGQFASQRGIQYAAILKDTDQSAQTFANSFSDQFKAKGGSIVVDEFVDLNTLDFGLYMRRYVEQKATAVLLAVSAERARTIIKQAKNAGLKLSFLGGELWDTPNFSEPLQQIGAQVYHVAAFASDDTTPEASNFVTAFITKYQRKPGGIAALAFDATNLALAAFARAPSATRPQFAASLVATRDFVGATGSLHGDHANGRKTKSAVIKELTTTGTRFVERVSIQ